ncbi:MAG: 7TM diverse intracellular signaling domain-containing protein, partial [Sulfurimonas sp.]
MLKIIYLLLITTIIHAIPIIDVEGKSINIKNFPIEYLIDKTDNLKIIDIVHSEFKATSHSNVSLGNNNPIAWIRFGLHNDTNESTTLFLHNQLAYIAHKLEFYEVTGGIISNRLNIDMTNHDDIQDKLYGTDAIFEIKLAPKQTKIIYIKSTIHALHIFNYTLYDKKNSKNFLADKHTFQFIILGMFIALTFYHLILYIASKQKEYLYYTLYLFCATLWEFHLSGTLIQSLKFDYNALSEY